MKETANTGRILTTRPAQPAIRQILVTTDFSNESRAGVSYGFKLAEKLGAAVSLFHVIEMLPAMEGMEGFPLLRPRPELLELARADLKKLARRERARNLSLTTPVCMGNPLQGIIAQAGASGADLIVMATHGYTGVNHALLGSTAERVVRHAPCPVLTVRTPAVARRGAKMPPFKLASILVPLDLSKVSKDVLPWATLLATRFEADIILFHVTEKYPSDYLLGAELMNHTLTPLMKQAEADLDNMAASLNKSTGVKTSVLVRDGTPYKEICRAAQDLNVDLIALTTHGYTGLKHVWLGSTAGRVVRHAHCPVLVVRDPKKPHLR